MEKVFRSVAPPPGHKDWPKLPARLDRRKVKKNTRRGSKNEKEIASDRRKGNTGSGRNLTVGARNQKSAGNEIKSAISEELKVAVARLSIA